MFSSTGTLSVVAPRGFIRPLGILLFIAMARAIALSDLVAIALSSVAWRLYVA
jgi:hypothetical protein